MQVVSRYALPYHPMSLMERNSSVMRGMAVDMIMLSCENKLLAAVDYGWGWLEGIRTRPTRNRVKHSPRVMATSLSPVGPSALGSGGGLAGAESSPTSVDLKLGIRPPIFDHLLDKFPVEDMISRLSVVVVGFFFNATLQYNLLRNGCATELLLDTCGSE